MARGERRVLLAEAQEVLDPAAQGIAGAGPGLKDKIQIAALSCVDKIQSAAT